MSTINKNSKILGFVLGLFCLTISNGSNATPVIVGTDYSIIGFNPFILFNLTPTFDGNAEVFDSITINESQAEVDLNIYAINIDFSSTTALFTDTDINPSYIQLGWSNTPLQLDNRYRYVSNMLTLFDRDGTAFEASFSSLDRTEFKGFWVDDVFGGGFYADSFNNVDIVRANLNIVVERISSPSIFILFIIASIGILARRAGLKAR
jgi:hypothetical protein